MTRRQAFAHSSSTHTVCIGCETTMRSRGACESEINRNITNQKFRLVTCATVTATAVALLLLTLLFHSCCGLPERMACWFFHKTNRLFVYATVRTVLYCMGASCDLCRWSIYEQKCKQTRHLMCEMRKCAQAELCFVPKNSFVRVGCVAVDVRCKGIVLAAC